MKRYKVVERSAQFGPGQVMHLTPAQVALRVHNLDAGKPDGKLVPVTVKAPIEFKTGEIVGLPEVSRHLEKSLEEVDVDGKPLTAAVAQSEGMVQTPTPPAARPSKAAKSS